MSKRTLTCGHVVSNWHLTWDLEPYLFRANHQFMVQVDMLGDDYHTGTYKTFISFILRTKTAKKELDQHQNDC
eukprot:m.137702 g.137702  ORF g.137702 m.137702 type:complete len:73 (-) comp13984_c0_seq1:1203-1421(-)